MNAVLKPLEISYGKSLEPTWDPELALDAVNQLMRRAAVGPRRDVTSCMAQHQIGTLGKQVRARLALQACACFGVRESSAIVWAAAVELLHNATLVHDDVQDGDLLRRGEPTVWARFGVAQAINVGDYLLMLPFSLLKELPREARAVLSPLVAEYAMDIVRGQVEDVAHDASDRVDFERYVRICEAKTGALLALPVVGAAVLGGLSEAESARFAAPFTCLGVMFQFQDDVVDLFGDKGRNSSGSDIYEGKVNALFVSLLTRRPDLSLAVRRVLCKPREEKTRADVDWLREQYLECGALTDVLAKIGSIQLQILGCPSLESEPKLRWLAQELTSLVIAPIRHLL